MSAQVLQRVVVRLLYDGAFVRDVYRDPGAALGGLALSDTERAWILAEDRRAWSIDPLRRTRGLEALLEEYPTAAAPWVAQRGVPQLDAFFSSSWFHDAVQERRSMALAFGGYLVDLATDRPARRALATLELGLAKVRRQRQPPWGQRDELRLAPHVCVLALAGGTLDGYQQTRVALASAADTPVAALLARSFEPPGVRVDPAAPEYVLAERLDSGEAALGFVPEPLFRLLDATTDGATEAALAAIVEAEGGSAADAIDLIEELVGDRLLVRPPH